VGLLGATALAAAVTDAAQFRSGRQFAASPRVWPPTPATAPPRPGLAGRWSGDRAAHPGVRQVRPPGRDLLARRLSTRLRGRHAPELLETGNGQKNEQPTVGCS